jgi:hypothetical protein
VRSCSPRLGRFDSGAAPSQRLQEAHRLPVHIESTLVADEPLDAWVIKATRVEPDPLEDDTWLALHEGQLPPKIG